LYIGGYFKYDENLKSFGKLKYVEGNIYSGNNSSLSKEKAELKQGSSFLLKKKFDEEVDIINTKNKEEIDRFNEFPFSFQYGITNKMREDAQKWDYIISDNWVSELTGEEFQKDDIPLTEKVTQFYKDNYNGQVEKDGLGTVLLDKRGVKSSLAHGIGSIKAAAFAAVPSIIQHGVIIDEQINWKGRGKDTCVIAAPLKIGNEGYTGLVVVTKYQGDNRFYLHEVLLQKNLQDATFQDLLQRKSSTLEGNQEVGTQESVVADFLPNDFAKILKNLQTASEIVKLRDTDVRFQYGSSGIGDINAEMEEIKSQAIANGTFMLAPNGNKTNLTEKQWLLVRTERFKKWFGDWLKVYRIEKLRSSQDIEISGNEITPDENIKQYKTNALEYGKTLRGEYTNKDTKEKILVPKIGIKEILRHDFGDIANIQGVAAIPQIIENSIYIDTIENEDLNKHPHITHYDYYVVGLKIGGEDYTVKAVIANDRNGQRYYDHALTQIEKGKLLDEVEGVTSPARQEEVFQKYKDKRLISILQVNSSKVVDENGEPMVVYHGTNKRFTVFDKNRIGSSTMDNAPFYGDGFYFSWDGGFAAPYALDENEKWSENSNINEAFLNIRNPLFVEDNNTEYRGKEIPSDYDGVILNSWMEFVAKEPNQIKSAIENTGEFNSENPDIRYFETPDGEVYGFVTPDNKVFLDIENMNFNTPIHEFGHLWNSFVYENHRELWNKGAELIKKTIYWELVNKDPRYKNLSEKQRLDEALATAIGDRGEQLLQNNKANNSLKAWLNELWNWIKKYMGIRDLNSDEISKLTFEEFIHGALADLLSGQSINKEMTVQNQLQDKINKIKNVLRQNETNPYHDYQIQKKAEGLKKAVLENNLISMYKSVFGTGNINVNKLITEVLNTEFAGNTADLIQKKLSEQSSENDLFTVLSPQHQKDMMKQGASGQLGISVHSAILAFMGLVQQSPEPIQFKRGKKNIKMVFGNLETNGLISKTMAVTPVRGNTNVTPRSMATINMENQNVSVDNQKLLIMAKRNENRHTINAFTVLSNVLGIDNDGLEVEGQEVSYPSLFLSQPILRRYVELMDYFNSATTEMGFETEKSVESVLIKEFGKDVTWDSSEDGTLTEGKLDHKVFQSTSLKLTSQHLYNSLINSDGNTQWTVYEKFKQLNNLSGIISKLQKFMNIENGGIGKSFFDVIEKKNFLIEELPFMNAELSNATGLIGEYAFTSDNEDISNLEDEGFIYIGENFENSSVLIKPTTPQGHKIVNSIVQADSLWGNIFPFESRYIKSQIDQVVQNSGVKTGTQKELNLKYKVLSDLKDYLYSTCTKSFGMTQQDDIDLFVDTETNKSLASYLCHLRLQKHPLMSMDFFNMLEFSLEGNTEPSLVKLNVTGLKKEEKSRIYNTLRQLYSSNEMLPDYNRQSYSYKELIRDLARYSLIANQENGAIGFRQYIPIEVFEDYGVLSVIKATAHTNSYTQHNLLYNSGGKALESLLGTSVNSDGIIVNGNHISAEIIKSYIEKINSKAGREEFKLKGKDVEVLNKKNDKFVSNFVKQYFQHNPEDALRIQFKKDNLQVMADEQKRIKGFVAPEGSNIAMNDFVHYKDKEGKIHLYQNVGKRTFLLIGKLGIFGVNEYNALATRRTSIFDVNKEGVVLYGNSSVPVQIQDIAGENEVKRYTLQSAFEKILKGDSKYKEVASFFMKYADSDVVVEFSNKLDESKDGAYTSKNKTIYLRSDLVNNEDFKVNQTVLLHEFMHSLTMDLIEQYVDLDIDENGKLTVLFKTDDIPQGLSKLISVYRFAIDKIVEEHGVEKFVRLFNQFKQDRTDISNEIEYAEEDMDIYFASDINEFIAGIFFDNQFKKKMSKVEYKSSNKSLLQNFVEALLKMYNSIFSTEGSIAQHTVDALVDLLETTQSVSKIPSPLSVQTVPSDMIDTDRMAESLIDKDFRIVDPNEVYQAMEKKGFPTGEFTAIIDDKEVKNTGNKIFVPSYSDLNLYCFRSDNMSYIVNSKTLQMVFKTEANTLLQIIHNFINYANNKITVGDVETFDDLIKTNFSEVTNDIPFLKQSDVDDVEKCD
jgi:hypothetical protein